MPASSPPFAIFTVLGGLLSRLGRHTASPGTAAPMPQAPVIVIGDLHGRADLLDDILARLASVADRDTRIIFAGDLIDRGPDSAGVLQRVRAVCTADPVRRICLMGNHERMLLDFLADPPRHGARWLDSGGEHTLFSFGIVPRHGRDMAAQYTALAARLRTALEATPGLTDWIAARPLFWQEGDLAVAHAGADAKRPLAGQGEDSLLWGRYTPRARQDGLWVVQGHIVVAAPVLLPGRIMIDTGAWTTGRLCAVRLAAGQEGPEWIFVHRPARP